MRKLSIKDAINEALVESFQNDKNVILMGEDIAGGKGREEYPGTQDSWGGPFGVTQGLLTKFGPERVRDTTITEAGFFWCSGWSCYDWVETYCRINVR